MNNEELIEYAIRTSKAIKEDVKPKLIHYFYKQREVINRATNWTIKYQTEWCQEDEVIKDLKQLLDILKGK